MHKPHVLKVQVTIEVRMYYSKERKSEALKVANYLGSFKSTDFQCFIT